MAHPGYYGPNYGLRRQGPYEPAVANLQQVRVTTDNFFGEDGGQRQLGTVTGSIEAGYVVELAGPVSAS